LRSLISANTPGEFSRGGRRRDFSLFGVFDHFVESLACGMPRKSRVNRGGDFSNIYKIPMDYLKWMVLAETSMTIGAC